MEQEPKFKVGDWLTCMDTPFDGYKGPGWKLGYTFKVGEVSVRGDKSCIFPEQHCTEGIFPRWLRLATSEEVQKVSPQAKEPDKWKVGDLLSQSWLSTQRTYTTDGKLHRAGFRSDRNRYVEEVTPLGWARISDTCTVWLMPKEDCKPISQAEIDCETGDSFKVGCRIRRTVYPGGDISVGDTGTVITIHGQGTKLMVRWDKTGRETECDMKYAVVIIDKEFLGEWKVGMTVQIAKLSHYLGVGIGEEGILIDIDKQCNLYQVRILSQNLWFPKDQLKISANNNNNNFSQLKSTENVSEQQCSSGSRNKSTNLRRKVKTIAGEESGESYPVRCKVKSKVSQK